jgi:hypothetical protein
MLRDGGHRMIVIRRSSDSRQLTEVPRDSILRGIITQGV